MKRHMRWIPSLILTMALGLAMVSCRDGGGTAPPDEGTLFLYTKDLPSGICDHTIPGDMQQEYLAAVDSISRTYAYEKAVEVVVPTADGGYGTGHPATWGDGYPFYVDVPPGVIDPELGPTVTITVWVPVLDTEFPCPEAPMPMILEPDGIDFSGDITIGVSQHPALMPDCESYNLFYVEPDPTFTHIYLYGGLQASRADDYGPVPCKTGIRAKVSHFSRWHMSRGTRDTVPH